MCNTTHYTANTGVLKKQNYFLKTLLPDEKTWYLISLKNYINRKEEKDLKLYDSIQIGDLCYMDYGHGYNLETGYQHLGIVLNKSHFKLFTVPLVTMKSVHSVEDIVNIAQNPAKTIVPKGYGGLTKDSVAHLNDAKWINYIRTIRIIGHIDCKDSIFKTLKKKTIDLIYN